MTVETLIQWAIRIVLAIIVFVVVRYGLPWLLGLGGITIPDPIILLLAVLAGLLTLAGGYYWRRAPVA